MIGSTKDGIIQIVGEVVQWYIDIYYQNSIENNIPYIDELFLDIILLPSGELIEIRHWAWRRI